MLALISTALVFFKPLDGFDLLVHYKNFGDYQIGQYELFERYIGIDVLIYIISTIGLEKNTLVLIASSMLLYSTYRFVEQKVQYERMVITFFIIMASYPLVLLVSGVRFSLALSFFLLADIYFSKGRYFRCVLFAATAVMFHYAASVLVFIYLISKLIPVERLNGKFLFCIFVLIIPIALYQKLLIDLVSFILNFVGFEHYVGLDLTRYISGEWGALRSASYNVNGLLGYFLPKIALCITGFVYLLTCRHKNSFIISLFFIVILFFGFGDIGDRYSIYLIPYIVTSLISSASRIEVKNLPISILPILSFAIINSFKEIWLYGEVYLNMLEQVILLHSPIFMLVGGV